MMSKYTVSAKLIELSKLFQHGKTQVPRDVRNFLNVKDGDRLLWYDDNGKVYVAKAE